MSSITLDQWLEQFGFKGNPFADQEAGCEDRLSEYFVGHPDFNRILGSGWSPESTLIFAPQGGGKTAQRKMVEYYCHDPNLTDGHILSVPYTDFSRVVPHSGINADPQLALRHHTEEILRQIMGALAGFWVDNYIAPKLFNRMKYHKKLYLSWFVTTYAGALSLEHTYAFSLLREPFLNFTSKDSDKTKKLLQAFSQRKTAPPVQLLDDLSQLLTEFDLHAVYILMDRVDELPETADNPLAAVALIRPLLMESSLMQLRRVAFKCFLPLELETVLETTSEDSLDSLTHVHIEWQDDDLQDLLHQRMQAFSRHQSFDALCVPKLRGMLEREMIELARGSPRRLLRLAELVLQEHCKLLTPKSGSGWLIGEQAWQAAKGRYMAKEKLPSPGVLEAASLSSEAVVSVDTLIERGESDRLEFKSTLCWDLRQDKRQSWIEKEIAKALAGLMNKEGGTLLIGVADDGEIVGLAYDLEVVHRKNLDGFQLTLTNIVKDYLGIVHYKHVHPRFVSVKDETVCVVSVDKGPEPVYLRDGEKREFWVRVGNSTRSMNVEEAVKYIYTHWDKAKSEKHGDKCAI